jgi:hypothetical protein
LFPIKGENAVTAAHGSFYGTTYEGGDVTCGGGGDACGLVYKFTP